MLRCALTMVLAGVLGLMAVPSSKADEAVLTFQGLGDKQAIGNYYDGGAGTNYGISFSSNIFALTSVLQGGAGNFANDPSFTPAMFISGTMGTNATGIMNVTAGFGTGISFFYTSAFSGTVTIWSGANGTGTALLTINLTGNDPSSICSSTPTSFCNWTPISRPFTGTAQSITFSGQANTMGFTDFVVGGTGLAVPEPAPFILLGSGILGTIIRKRQFFGRRR